MRGDGELHIKKGDAFVPKRSDYVKFLVPSLIGIFLFIVPIRYKGEITLPVAFLANGLGDILADVLPFIAVLLLLVTVLLTVVAKVFKPEFMMNRAYLKGLFDVGYLWVTARVLGALFAVMTYYELGPEIVWSENTGAIALYDLASFLLVIFLFAGLLLPLLLNFGLLEFFGTLMSKVMRPLFTLPGRSAIDCLASWIGDGTIGVLLTSKQYEEGYYSKREAAVIGTTFSLVSITFSIVVLGYMDLMHLFPKYYLTIVAAGLVAAVIMPRIPPLSRKSDDYFEPVGKQLDNTVSDDAPLFKKALTLAAEQARKVKGASAVVKGGVQNVLDMWIGVVPVVVTLATLANIVVEYTPFFEYLGAPFVPLLSLLQVPEASEAAQTVVVGFADMLLPALIGSGIIESEFTKFVIASLSVTQLIYLSEVGALLLGSKLPVNFLDLIIIFLERTVITLPVIVFMAHLLF